MCPVAKWPNDIWPATQSVFADFWLEQLENVSTSHKMVGWVVARWLANLATYLLALAKVGK